MATANVKTTIHDELRQRDWKAFQRILRPCLILEAAKIAAVALGKGPLHLGNLVWLAVSSAWYYAKSFAAVLSVVMTLMEDREDWPNSPLHDKQTHEKQTAKKQRRHKHDPRGQDPTKVSEEAFVQARNKLPTGFWVALLMVLTREFEIAYADYVRWKRFRLLTVDGTSLALDNHPRLADHFGTTSNGRGRRRPQARLVMMQFGLVRLPWRYELVPWTESENAVAKRLFRELHKDDLVLMDRGFWSYGLFWQIQNRGAYFGTRLKKGIRLRTLKRLGRGDRLVQWAPYDWARDWQKEGLPPSIQLRVIDYQMAGFRKSAVVTNVLDPQEISASEWVRMAAIDAAGHVIEPGLYHRRWEIETSFCELKVTQGLKENLRSRSPAGICFEVAGHVLLYLLTRWLMVEAAQQAGIKDPLRLSFKKAREEVGNMRETLMHAGAEHTQGVLLPRLLERIASHEVPLRPGRHYPRPRDTKPKAKGKGRYQQPSKLKAKTKAKSKNVGKKHCEEIWKLKRKAA